MIKLKNVSKTYPNGIQALKNVNLDIKKGEFVFVVGASGAGKSTFLKLLLREEVPTSGRIEVNNHDLNKMKESEIPYFRRTLGVVFQDFRLIPNMNAYDNVAFAMRVIGENEKKITKRVPEILELVGLSSRGKSLPTELSGGEQQRVALARALANNAELIIADEPTGNVDPEMSKEILALLDKLNRQGATIVMVTHARELIKGYTHRQIKIDDGCIAADDGCATVVKVVPEPPETPSHEDVLRSIKEDIYSVYFGVDELDKTTDDEVDDVENEETVQEEKTEKDLTEKSMKREKSLSKKKSNKTVSEKQLEESSERYAQVRDEIEELLRFENLPFYEQEIDDETQSGGGT